MPGGNGGIEKPGGGVTLSEVRRGRCKDRLKLTLEGILAQTAGILEAEGSEHRVKGVAEERPAVAFRGRGRVSQQKEVSCP